MPMYEFRCNKCGGTFEELVFASDETVPCPQCGSQDTEKMISKCAHKTAGSAIGEGPSYWGSGEGGHGSGCSCAGCSGGNCSTCAH